MARPLKEGLDYFPLDVDIDQDDKVAIIEALHGAEGFAVVIKLLMKIYKEGYFYEWTNREQILFSKRVNVDNNTVKEIVNDCIKEGLFNGELHEQHNILTSKGIQSRYLEAAKRRKEVTFLKKYFLIKDVESITGSNKIAVFTVDDNGNKVNVNNNYSLGVHDVNKSTQRKGKEIESKKKEKKKDSIEPKILYGESTLLTNEEYDKLVNKMSEGVACDYIERLDNYIGQIGKDKYKSHYHTILNWYKKDNPNKPEGENKNESAARNIESNNSPGLNALSL
ncbi:replication initiation protein [Bacillus phage Pavlov]|uniref:replication initiation protein n=1 Tax=Bacillus phage Pavlov TaxID=1675598 RepID=UPI00065F6310|nr:replication initiation protein [Bacillus phage Pavlov]AKQ07459.1 DNA replication protein [Bacillus phage Pavlov]